VPRGNKVRREAKAAGYASGLEFNVATILEGRDVHFKYEEKSFDIWLPQNKNKKLYCQECGSREVGKKASYTPDFFVYPEDMEPFIIETKGILTPLDRDKALALREAEPDLLYRFVFGADNKLTRSAKSRYSDWCKKNEFEFAVKEIPKGWTTEKEG